MIIPSANNQNIELDQSSVLGGTGRISNLLGGNSGLLNTLRLSSARHAIDNNSTNFVLFCNPNACFYEFINYQSEWLKYYT
jgi:hypothetical protein